MQSPLVRTGPSGCEYVYVCGFIYMTFVVVVVVVVNMDRYVGLSLYLSIYLSIYLIVCLVHVSLHL